MNTQQFIGAIKEAVYEQAFLGLIEALKSPPGRRPDPRLLKLSDWYHSLTPDAQAMASELTKAAAKQATYNFLLLLDGLLAAEARGEKGEFQLFYTKDGISAILNPRSENPLSNIFKALLS
ncbi:MAG TPA: hypothetical protein VJ063_15570 [Verrucomicrobiae bacterium]|nr:hypothetical protein [Verrucomicrobiae bacterium]